MDSTNLYFMQRNVSVILINRDTNTEIQNWMSYADTIQHDSQYDHQNQINASTPIKQQSYELVIVDENTPLHIQFPPPPPSSASSTTTSYEPVSLNDYDNNTPIKQNNTDSTPFRPPLSTTTSNEPIISDISSPKPSNNDNTNDKTYKEKDNNNNNNNNKVTTKSFLQKLLSCWR